MHAYGYAATAADRPITPFEFEVRALKADDVEIRIEFCGVCHSDLHVARNEWGFTRYPVVLGHEIIGRVTQVGTDVTKFSAGMLVGVGCMVDSCQTCQPCHDGLEQYCETGFTSTSSADPEGGTMHGGYSDRIVVRESFVVKVPEGLEPAAAAPLLCAGITAYSPLRHWGAGPGKKIGIVGLGGVGHIAVKLARAMGAHVAVLTSSPDKEREARAMGADEVIVGTAGADFAAQARSFDLLINTVSAPMPLDLYVGLLKLDGVMVMLGAGGSPHQPAATYSLQVQRRSIAGSVVGGIAETQEMLEFCALHGLTCDIELVRPDQVNEVFDRMDRGDVKFRFVLDVRLLGQPQDVDRPAM